MPSLEDRQRALGAFVARSSSRESSEAALLAQLRNPATPERERLALEERLFLLVRARIGAAIDGFRGGLTGWERDDLVTEVWLHLRQSNVPDLRMAIIRRIALQLVQSKLRRRDCQTYLQAPLPSEGADSLTRALDSLPDRSGAIADRLASEELLRIVTRRLGKENALPFLWNALYGMEHGEIAARLGIGEEASKKRAQRAASRLRTLCQNDDSFRSLFL